MRKCEQNFVIKVIKQAEGMDMEEHPLIQFD